jgi:hypothetical protein
LNEEQLTQNVEISGDAVEVLVGGRHNDGAGVPSFVRLPAVNQGQGGGLQFFGLVAGILRGDQSDRIFTSGENDVALRT